jgi:hypothetical protein
VHRSDYSFENPHIAGAAADVAGQAFADLGICGVRVRVEKFEGGHDHAGSADAALGGSVGDESLLDLVKSGPIGYAFDGLNVGSFNLQGWDEAAVYKPSIEHDGTGSALPFSAALLGTGEAQVQAENIEKAGHGPCFDFARFVVDSEADEDLRHRDPPGRAGCD